MAGSTGESLAARTRVTIGVIAGLIVSFLVIIDPIGLVHAFEMRLLDARQKAFASKSEITDEIVIVDISEESIRALEPVYGRWPWPRSVHGELLNFLESEEAVAVGFDVLFSEQAKRSELDEERLLSIAESVRSAESGSRREEVAAQIASLRPGLADEDFSRAALSFERVVQAALFFTSESARLAQPSSAADEGGGSRIRSALEKSRITLAGMERLPVFHNAAVPIESLAASAQSIGHVNFSPDPDGPCRRTYPLVGFRSANEVYPSFPLAMAAVALRIPVKEISLGGDYLRLGVRTVPIDDDGALLIRYQGGTYSEPAEGDGEFTSHYKTYPYFAVLLSVFQADQGETPIIPAGTFKDKLVLVGSTAAGLKDLRATPFNATSPGVEIHANVLDNILAARFLAPLSRGTARLIVVCGAMAIGLTAALAGPGRGLLFSALIIGTSMIISWQTFAGGTVIPMAGQITAGALSFLSVVMTRYVIEEKEKRRLRKAFGHYLSSAVLDEVLRDPASLELGGRKKTMTVLFSDITGFTGLSETMEPELISRLLNSYLNRMVACVHETGGILDKFIGDAIVAEWNAPGEVPDHAARACECALRMLNEADALKEEWRANGAPDLEIRIGINTGEMVVGNMGSDDLFDYTVIGNEVNTAARLEPLNKEFGSRIAISGSVLKEANRHRPGEFAVRELARVRLIGRDGIILVYELMGRTSELTASQRAMLPRYEEAIIKYLARDFRGAGELFSECINLDSGDSVARAYLQLTKDDVKTPPTEEWEGIYIQKWK